MVNIKHSSPIMVAHTTWESLDKRNKHTYICMFVHIYEHTYIYICK